VTFVHAFCCMCFAWNRVVVIAGVSQGLTTYVNELASYLTTKL